MVQRECIKEISNTNTNNCLSSRNVNQIPLPIYLFKTRVLRASPSTSSAIMTKGFRWALAISRAGTMDWTLEIFFSLNRTYASWNSHFWPKKQRTFLTNLRLFCWKWLQFAFYFLIHTHVWNTWIYFWGMTLTNALRVSHIKLRLKKYSVTHLLLPFDVLIKYGEIYPLSNFMPSIISNSSFSVFPSYEKSKNLLCEFHYISTKTSFKPINK